MISYMTLIVKSARAGEVGCRWARAGEVGRHPANNIGVEGLGCHPAKETEGRGVCLIHDAGNAGVASLVVRDGGEDRHDICDHDELLGVPVRLRDRKKSSRRRNSRVLLREVGRSRCTL